MPTENALVLAYLTSPHPYQTDFAAAGVELIVAATLDDLIPQADALRPDAILLEVDDVPMNLDVCRTLNALPIFIIGPTHTPVTIDAFFQAGVVDYVAPDTPAHLLLQKIGRWVGEAGRESELRMRLALIERAKQEWEVGVDSLTELICVLGPDGRVIRTNRALEAWGMGRVQEVRGKTLAGLFRTRYPALTEPIDELVYTSWADLQNGHFTQQELWDAESGQYFRVELRPLTSHTHHATESEAVAIFENITPRKQAEQELAHHAAELEERNRDLDAYGHTVAHDLKSPLNLVLGYAEFLATSSPEELVETAYPYLGKITENAVRMAEMIDQLLLLASTRNATEQVVLVDVAPLVSIAVARFEREIMERRIAIEILPTMPSALGHGPWVVEIFANLVGNAIKYMGTHNATPTIQIRGFMDGNSARYEVQDTGVGIAPDDQKRLFEMFSRMHTDMAEGTGLGLSIVHRLVTRQNGKIGVVSALGKGSTFWFTLPCA